MLPFQSMFMGANVVPGSQTYNVGGTYSFTVPAFNTMTVEVWGGGGGGGNYTDTGAYSPSGGNSVFHTAYAYGGGGGGGAATSRYGGVVYGGAGAGGSSANGNVTAIGGNAGYAGDSGILGVGAGAPNGGANAYPGYRESPSTAGSTPGGGGAGYYYDTGGKFPAVAGGAGSGAYAKSVFTPVMLAPSTVLTVYVGSGASSGGAGGTGGDGKITVVWA